MEAGETTTTAAGTRRQKRPRSDERSQRLRRTEGLRERGEGLRGGGGGPRVACKGTPRVFLCATCIPHASMQRDEWSRAGSAHRPPSTESTAAHAAAAAAAGLPSCVLSSRVAHHSTALTLPHLFAPLHTGADAQKASNARGAARIQADFASSSAEGVGDEGTGATHTTTQQTHTEQHEQNERQKARTASGPRVEGADTADTWQSLVAAGDPRGLRSSRPSGSSAVFAGPPLSSAAISQCGSVR